jgi:hypothetical protein
MHDVHTEALMNMARRNIQPKEQPAEILAETSDATDSFETAPGAESVAMHAYRRFEERGREHGRDLDDWLEAERQLSNRTTE